MPITPFLRNQEFDPDAVEAMASAFTKICRSLGLSNRADPMTEIVARRIIEFAQRGMRNDTALYRSVLQEFQEKH
jgi:hypothetical protein